MHHPVDAWNDLLLIIYFAFILIAPQVTNVFAYLWLHIQSFSSHFSWVNDGFPLLCAFSLVASWLSQAQIFASLALASLKH